MALGRLTSFTFGNSFLTLVYANSQTYYVSYAHIIAGESDSRSGDLTIWIYTAGEVGETLSVKNSDLVAIGSSATAFLALFNQNIQPYSYWQDFLDSTTASGALPSEPSALRGQCLYARFRPIYNFGSASLINVPARFKAGTLYSQVPDTGAGDFTVTRTTTPTAGRSTRINKDGLIELVADNVPRLDYPLGGAVNGCPALLVEPSAVNLALHSRDLTQAAWVASGITPLRNAVGMDGAANTGTTLTATGANGTILQTLTHASQVRAFSAYVRRTVGTGTIEITTNGGTTWTPITLTSAYTRFSTTATVTNGQVGFRIVTSGDAIVVDYCQGEVGTVATSAIPTTTGPVTRGAETISKTGVSSLIGQTEGTIYMEVDIRNMGKEVYLMRIDNSANSNVIFLRTLTTNVVRNTIIAPTTSGTVNISSAAFTAGIVKIAFAYKSGEIALSVNGATALTTDGTFAFNAALSRIHLGGNVGANEFNDRIRAAALYTNRLTNAQLAALTAP